MLSRGPDFLSVSSCDEGVWPVMTGVALAPPRSL